MDEFRSCFEQKRHRDRLVLGANPPLILPLTFSLASGAVFLIAELCAGVKQFHGSIEPLADIIEQPLV